MLPVSDVKRFEPYIAPSTVAVAAAPIPTAAHPAAPAPAVKTVVTTITGASTIPIFAMPTDDL